MTATLLCMRGLPASGKTTYAKALGSARVSRDDYRAMMFGAEGDAYQAYFSHPDFQTREQAVTIAQTEAVRELLAGGYDVVVDDTNLRIRYLRRFRELSLDVGASFGIYDMTDVPVEVCIERDRARGWKVGEKVIRDMAAKLKSMDDPAEVFAETTLSSRKYLGALPGMNYALPRAWIVDIDGTVALMNGRSPYDYSRVSDDAPNDAVIELLQNLSWQGDTLLFVSGRDAECRMATEDWLWRHVALAEQEVRLFMRPMGDKRDDAIVKEEIFWRDIAPNWSVRGVFDDRNRVVRMWRRIGLQCYQVAPGAF